MIFCAQVAVLPQASVALNVRVSKYLFSHCLLLITSPTCIFTTLPPQLSFTVTSIRFIAGTWLAQVTVVLDGQTMVGAVWSFTVIVCLHVAVFPQASVTL
jgi:hypothetical protein